MLEECSWLQMVRISIDLFMRHVRRTVEYFLARLERLALDTFISLHSESLYEIVIVSPAYIGINWSEDFIDDSDLALVLEINRTIDKWSITMSSLADHEAFTSVGVFAQDNNLLRRTHVEATSPSESTASATSSKASTISSSPAKSASSAASHLLLNIIYFSAIDFNALRSSYQFGLLLHSH